MASKRTTPRPVDTLSELETVIPKDLRAKIRRTYQECRDIADTVEDLRTEFRIRSGGRVVSSSVARDFVFTIATGVEDSDPSKVQFTILKHRDPRPKDPDDNIWD